MPSFKVISRRTLNPFFLKWSIWSLRWDCIQFQQFLSVHCIDTWRTKLREMYNNFYWFFDLFFWGGNNYSKHFVLCSVCSELYSICLLTEYLCNGCLVSYLGSSGMGAFLPSTFLEVCWLSVLWSGTLIPEPGAHKGRQHSVQGCVSVSSALKQSTLECRIPCTGRDPQEWWGQCWLHVPLVLPPELLCAKPAGCVCVQHTTMLPGAIASQSSALVADPKG